MMGRMREKVNRCVRLTVGTYSEGNLFVVYEMRRHVFPTAPSPTTTHLMVCIGATVSDGDGGHGDGG